MNRLAAFTLAFLAGCASTGDPGASSNSGDSGGTTSGGTTTTGAGSGSTTNNTSGGTTTTGGGTTTGGTTGGGTTTVYLTKLDPAQHGRNLPWSFTAIFDSATNTVTLSDKNGTSILTRAPSFDHSTIQGFFDSSIDFALYAVTPTGGGSAVAAGYGSAGYHGITFSRLGTTDLPSTGSANFDGAYSGLLADDTAISYDLIWGDVALSADFDGGTIDGSITNRTSNLGGGWTYADVTLSQANILNGAFDGIATGGEGDGIHIGTTSNGQYSGAIVGADGTEIVGGLVMDHIMVGWSGNPYTEHGIFASD